MALRGAKPHPTVLKKIRATRKRADQPLGRTVVPAPPAGQIVCPPAVLKSPAAKRLWDLYTTKTAPGHLAPVDAPLLARAVLTGARVEAAERAMSERVII